MKRRYTWAELMKRVFKRRTDYSRSPGSDRAYPDYTPVPSTGWSGDRRGGEAAPMGRGSGLLPRGGRSSCLNAGALDQLGARWSLAGRVGWAAPIPGRRSNQTLRIDLGVAEM